MSKLLKLTIKASQISKARKKEERKMSILFQTTPNTWVAGFIFCVILKGCVSSALDSCSNLSISEYT